MFPKRKKVRWGQKLNTKAWLMNIPKHIHPSIHTYYIVSKRVFRLCNAISHQNIFNLFFFFALVSIFFFETNPILTARNDTRTKCIFGATFLGVIFNGMEMEWNWT